MFDDAAHVGRTIAALRKASGLTQLQLANKVNVSLSLLQKVEVGDRAATHGLMSAVARVLRVPLERLTGQPYTDDRKDEKTHRHIDALRAVLRRYDLPDEVPARTVAELARDVDGIARLRRDAEYAKLAARLPALLEELARAARESPGTDVWSLLVTAYHATHTLVYRLGYGDLAEAVEHKLTWAAEQTGNPLAGALAQRTRCVSFQSAGDFAAGLRLMDTARDELDDELRSRPAGDVITVYGSLHLRSVTLASRAGDSGTTRAHLDAARELADRIDQDQVHWGLTFGSANSTTHEVAAHVELGDGPAAIEAAHRWRAPRSMPRTRRGHHHIDVARAHLVNDDRDAALRSLLEARRIAPQLTRLHPMVREMTAVLVTLHRRSNPELTNYAHWLGLTG
ncbi:helix-turn-helix domain-containing protein [Actinokineospora iranica]|uniref:Transcriptional regulator, contains XRE-family HTH domain n=1 Tax=Actinokineospora iranica TaxID=1271860 RepID=A0A1G6LRM6_9PSEU|nr:helix-turn-helix transcriptional regulator [Actinokineospora iranica]SDC45415.1 Transcriptional regulator, contains XRE-family HTH domain [Actinokineospora iranica]